MSKFTNTRISGDLNQSKTFRSKNSIKLRKDKRHDLFYARRRKHVYNVELIVP